MKRFALKMRYILFASFFVPLPILLFIRPDFNFFNDFFYLEMINNGSYIRNLSKVIFSEELEQGFFTPLRFILESTQYIIVSDNPLLLLFLNSIICTSIIFLFMIYTKKMGITQSYYSVTGLLILTFLWPWTLDLYVFAGTVEKYLLLVLIVSIISISSPFKTKVSENLYFFIQFIILTLGLSLRIQFAAFIPGLFYYMISLHRTNYRKIILLIIIPVFVEIALLLIIFSQGSYTKKNFFEIQYHFLNLKANLAYYPNYIFYLALISILILHIYTFCSKKMLGSTPELNLFFLLIMTYSLALIMWGELGFHLSVLGVLIGIYIILVFNWKNYQFFNSNWLIRIMAVTGLILCLLFSIFKYYFSLTPPSTLREFFTSNTFRELNSMHNSFIIPCEEPYARMYDFASRSDAEIKARFIYINSQSDIDSLHSSNQIFMISNNSYCPIDFNLFNTYALIPIWNSTRLNSYQVYRINNK